MTFQSLFPVLRRGAPIAALLGCFALLWPTLEQLDLSQLAQIWQKITLTQWVLAAGLSAVSFWAVSQYDVLAHRHLRTGLSDHRARGAGLTAIALSQTTGAGPFVASLVRWRVLPEFNALDAARVTGFVTGLFLFSIAVILSLTILLLPSPAYAKWAALAVLLGTTTVSLAACLKPRLRLAGFRLDLPGLRGIGAGVFWAAVDVFAAALALYVLISPDHAPHLWAFLPVFCLALTAGLVSGTPGGAGPFELVLLGMLGLSLPTDPGTGAVLVAIMAFRLVYYLIPALLALAVLMPERVAPPKNTNRKSARYTALPRAESGVARQNGAEIHRVADQQAALWPTPQALVGLFDPSGRPANTYFSQFEHLAKAQNRFAAIYKCSAHIALAARAAGWRVLHIADDAIVSTQQFNLNVPERARLRRKLRKAEGAGVTIRPALNTDLSALVRIDAAWQDRNGPARGGTMGRFCPDYLRAQCVLVAEQDSKPIAFITLHTAPDEWTLDLMRDSKNCPDGTMFALATAAIEMAAVRGVARVCLAATPACPDPHSALWRALTIKSAEFSHGAGLRQFKSAFAPQWKPLYLAAPTPLALGVAGLDIAREVFWPMPLELNPNADLKIFHENDEDYEVVSKAAA